MQQIHAYPRSDDPIGGNVSVGIGSTSATTLTINVGVSTIVNYNISTAAYTASTGIMTVFSNVHGFNGAYQMIKQSSLQLMMLVVVL